MQLLVGGRETCTRTRTQTCHFHIQSNGCYHRWGRRTWLDRVQYDLADDEATYPFPARYKQLQLSSILLVRRGLDRVARLMLTPERHANTRNTVKSGETTDGRVVARFPEGQLAIAHSGETGGGESVMLS